MTTMWTIGYLHTSDQSYPCTKNRINKSAAASIDTNAASAAAAGRGEETGKEKNTIPKCDAEKLANFSIKPIEVRAVSLRMDGRDGGGHDVNQDTPLLDT